MHRHRIVALTATVALVLGALLAGAFGRAPAYAATSTQQTFLTFYGWWDNTPPGGEISNPVLHKTAGGTGTFADPITVAAGPSELKPGSKIFVPRVKKYFIVEDECPECEADFKGHGPNGGPGLWHFDLWLGGQGGDPIKAIDCEDALTNYNADSTPNLEPVIIDPPANEPFDATPIFNTKTGMCYGNAQPHSLTGQFKNTSTSMCLDDPGNSTTVGTVLKLAPCSTAPEQTFFFHGAFMTIHDNLCAAGKSGNLTLQKCNAGPDQQWSVNPNGTISDIQTGRKCFRASGTNVQAGSCTGAESQWTYPPAIANDFTVAVDPASGSVTAGGSTSAAISTRPLSGLPPTVALSASGLPTGAKATFNPASVTAGDSSTVTITTAATTPNGTYPITVSGSGSGVTHTTTYTLTVGTPSTNDFSVAVNPSSGTVAAGSSVTAAVTAGVVSGTPGSVALSASGAPAGVTVSFSPASVTPGGGASTMTVATTAAAPPGPVTITVTGTAGAVTHSAGYGLTVTGTGGGTPVLLSQDKPATASSTKNPNLAAKFAVDGSATTRWASKKNVDPVWLQVDLGATASISEVKLAWDSAYASAYAIQVSADGKTWTTVSSTATGDGGTDDLKVSASGRYVRMNGTKRATKSGYSLDEFQVYGTTS